MEAMLIFKLKILGSDEIWSDERTWGMSFKPADGDLVYVPKGQVLWVDQSTPKLIGIVVEGRSYSRRRRTHDYHY